MKKNKPLFKILEFFFGTGKKNTVSLYERISLLVVSLIVIITIILCFIFIIFPDWYSRGLLI